VVDAHSVRRRRRLCSCGGRLQSRVGRVSTAGAASHSFACCCMRPCGSPGGPGVVRPFSSSTAPVGGSWHYPACTKTCRVSPCWCGGGQAAGLTVAQHVVDDLEHLASRGEGRDVAHVLAAPGDDAVADRLHRGFDWATPTRTPRYASTPTPCPCTTWRSPPCSTSSTGHDRPSRGEGRGCRLARTVSPQRLAVDGRAAASAPWSLTSGFRPATSRGQWSAAPGVDLGPSRGLSARQTRRQNPASDGRDRGGEAALEGPDLRRGRGRPDHVRTADLRSCQPRLSRAASIDGYGRFARWPVSVAVKGDVGTATAAGSAGSVNTGRYSAAAATRKTSATLLSYAWVAGLTKASPSTGSSCARWSASRGWRPRGRCDVTTGEHDRSWP
jgi:hypothetical protein